MHEYQLQDSHLSLRDGIAEYRRVHPFLKRGGQVGAAAATFFERHDAVHVLYGCDTSLIHEAVVKIASIFGTTGGFAVLTDYGLRDMDAIYRDLGGGEIVRTIARCVVAVPRTVWRCSRQNAKWPWSTFEEHLETPLAELRQTFGIRVVAQ